MKSSSITKIETTPRKWGFKSDLLKSKINSKMYRQPVEGDQEGGDVMASVLFWTLF